MNEACGLRFEIHVFFISVPQDVLLLGVDNVLSGCHGFWCYITLCLNLIFDTGAYFACISVPCTAYLKITADIPSITHIFIPYKIWKQSVRTLHRHPWCPED